MTHVSSAVDLKADTNILVVYSNCLSLFGKIYASNTGKLRQLWQNRISMTVTQNQQLNQDCFTGTRQININNACEWNCFSTWLVLNQLLRRKLTQTSSPAWNKCDCCPQSMNSYFKKRIRHCFTFPQHATLKIDVFSLILFPQCAAFTQGMERRFSLFGIDKLNWGRIRKSNPIQITCSSATNWTLTGFVSLLQ